MEIQVLGYKLDREQIKAICEIEKNTMIIAGAGSGKSLTMVAKIKYLVEEKNISLNTILAITFTNMAARSLEDKIKLELKEKFTVFTFHKLALNMLNDCNVNYYIESNDMLDYVVKEVFTSIGLEPFFIKMFGTKNYLELEDFYSFQEMIIRFLKLYQNEFYDIDYFDIIIKHAKKKDKSILILLKKLYEIYILEKKSQGMIDFDDMIIMATKLVLKNGTKNHYQYIIIDEYQDTSKLREDFIRAIYHVNNSIITVVGDDFQSIYRFAGCNVEHFLTFKKRFHAKKYYLNNTYRNSQELINVAGSFILENKKQIYKKLKSNLHILKPIVIMYYNNSKNDFIKALKIINSNKLMILGRNNYDIDNVLKNKNMLNDNIYYKTIHKAKGLEEENVLIINLNNNCHSLPTYVKEERLLKYVTTMTDEYPYEEERRLFYVGLTRTKNKCYLFVDKNNPSIFIEELLRKHKKYIEIIYL